MALTLADFLHYHGLSVVGILCVCLLFEVCSSQDTVLPRELQQVSTIQNMRSIFCSSCRDIDQPQIRSPTDEILPFCQQLCQTSHPRVCWSLELQDTECETDDQQLVCGYEDAIVCQYEDMRGSCVYHSSSQFCICKKETGRWSEDSRENCDLLPPRVPIDQAPQATLPSINRCRFGQDPPDGQSCRETQPTTQEKRDTATTEPPGGLGSDGQPNVTAVVLGGVLSLVLLLVIIGAVGWYLRRQGKTCAPTKKTPKPDDSAHVDQNVNTAGAKNTNQLPEQLVPGSHEYAYVESHWQLQPTNPETGEPKPVVQDTHQEDHYYVKLEKDENGEGNNRYVKNGPGNILFSKGPSTEASDDPLYFELEKERDCEDTSHTDNEARSAYTNEGIDLDYQTPAALQVQNGNSAYEVATLAEDDKDLLSSTYDRLDRSFNKNMNKGVLTNMRTVKVRTLVLITIIYMLCTMTAMLMKTLPGTRMLNGFLQWIFQSSPFCAFI